MLHDYLTQRGGAERVVLAMMQAFPGARLITSVYEADATFPQFEDYDIETSWLNRVGPLRRDPRLALPFLANAFSTRGISDVDIVLCSSSGWAHGIRTDAPKIVYCHNPARWLHQRADYARDQGLPARVMLEVLRRPLTRWDQQAASTATAYLANSTSVRDRVWSAYGIEAEVLAPPIGVDALGEQEPFPGMEPGFVLHVSRARGYKNGQVVAESIEQMPGERLVMVGGLPHRDHGSWSPRLQGVSNISDAQLRWLYANCSMLLAVSYEDFGLTPLEANAFGKPVLCLRAGGYLDTMRHGDTGLYVDHAGVPEVMDGIRSVNRGTWSEIGIKAHAERYSPSVFAARLLTIADEVRGLSTELDEFDELEDFQPSVA